MKNFVIEYHPRADGKWAVMNFEGQCVYRCDDKEECEDWIDLWILDFGDKPLLVSEAAE